MTQLPKKVVFLWDYRVLNPRHPAVLSDATTMFFTFRSFLKDKGLLDGSFDGFAFLMPEADAKTHASVEDDEDDDTTQLEDIQCTVREYQFDDKLERDFANMLCGYLNEYTAQPDRCTFVIISRSKTVVQYIKQADDSGFQVTLVHDAESKLKSLLTTYAKRSFHISEIFKTRMVDSAVNGSRLNAHAATIGAATDQKVASTAVGLKGFEMTELSARNPAPPPPPPKPIFADSTPLLGHATPAVNAAQEMAPSTEWITDMLRHSVGHAAPSSPLPTPAAVVGSEIQSSPEGDVWDEEVSVGADPWGTHTTQSATGGTSSPNSTSSALRPAPPPPPSAPPSFVAAAAQNAVPPPPPPPSPPPFTTVVKSNGSKPPTTNKPAAGTHNKMPDTFTIDGIEVPKGNLLRNAFYDYCVAAHQFKGRMCNSKSDHSPLECNFAHLDSYQVNGLPEPVEGKELLQNQALKSLRTHSNYKGNFCTSSKPHDFMKCSYLHRRK